MGSTKVQGREPRMMGAAMPTRTEKLVKVSWRTVAEYEVMVPVSVWERMGGAEGDTNDVVDDYLGDVEDLGGGKVGVVEREVRDVEHGFEQ